MELLMLVSIVLCALVGTLVGAKLLSIAARSRKFPEFAIGGALFAYAALSQTGLLVYNALDEESSLALRMGIVAVRVLAFYITLLGLSLFTWRVFGADSQWRRALAFGLALAALISAGVSLWDTWLHLSANVPKPLYSQIGMTPHYVLVFGWVSLESLHYYAMMRKRRALGLADPVVTNRFFVWGAGEGVASLVVLGLLVAMVTAGRQFSVNDPLVSALVTLAGIVNALVWWFTFTPPAAYVRWIRGNAAEGAAVG